MSHGGMTCSYRVYIKKNSYSCEKSFFKETISKQKAHILISFFICINWAIFAHIYSAYLGKKISHNNLC